MFYLNCDILKVIDQKLLSYIFELLLKYAAASVSND